MYKIIDIHNTQSAGWVARVLSPLNSTLPISIPVSELSACELEDYANTDAEHIAIADPRTPEQIEMDVFDLEWKETYQSL